MCVYVRKSAQAGFGSTAGWGIIFVNTYMVCDERHGQIDILMCSSHITDKNKIPKIISLYPTCLLSLPHNMYMLLCMRNRGASRSGDHEIDIEFYNKRRSRDTIHATGEARATASSEAVALTVAVVGPPINFPPCQARDTSSLPKYPTRPQGYQPRDLETLYSPF